MMRGLVLAACLLAPALANPWAKDGLSNPAADITLYTPPDSQAGGRELTFRVDISETDSPCGPDTNVRLNGQRLIQDGSGAGEGVVTSVQGNSIGANWHFTCVEWDGMPQEQLLTLQVNSIDGEAQQDVGFVLRFQQAPQVWFFNIDGPVTIAPVQPEPLDDGTIFENTVWGDLQAEIAELEYLRARLAEIEEMILIKEQQLTEAFGWGDQKKSFQQCDSLKCIFKTAYDHVHDAAKNLYDGFATGHDHDHSRRRHGGVGKHGKHGKPTSPPFCKPLHHGNGTQPPHSPPPHHSIPFHPPSFCNCPHYPPRGPRGPHHPPPPPPPPPPPGHGPGHEEGEFSWHKVEEDGFGEEVHPRPPRPSEDNEEQPMSPPNVKDYDQPFPNHGKASHAPPHHGQGPNEPPPPPPPPGHGGHGHGPGHDHRPPPPPGPPSLAAFISDPAFAPIKISACVILVAILLVALHSRFLERRSSRISRRQRRRDARRAACRNLFRRVAFWRRNTSPIPEEREAMASHHLEDSDADDDSDSDNLSTTLEQEIAQFRAAASVVGDMIAAEEGRAQARGQIRDLARGHGVDPVTPPREMEQRTGFVTVPLNGINSQVPTNMAINVARIPPHFSSLAGSSTATSMVTSPSPTAAFPDFMPIDDALLPAYDFEDGPAASHMIINGVMYNQSRSSYTAGSSSSAAIPGSADAFGDAK